MSRVLFWNVQQFGINKINDPNMSRKRKKGIGGDTPHGASLSRRAIMMAILAAAQADIIVIVELGCGDDGNQRATNGGGMQAAIYLLNSLRALFAASRWRLVPPLRVGANGPSETVAVLYRGVTGAGAGLINRYFTGPNVWVGAQGGTSQDPAGGAVGNAYPGVVAAGDPNLNAMLVYPGAAVRVIPAGAIHNGGTNEDRVAARLTYGNAGGVGIVNYGVNIRQPYMVTFTETNAAGVVQGDITLFGVHAPPNNAGATQFILDLSNSAEVTFPLGGVERRAIGGDFNLEMLTAAGAQAAIYLPLAPYQALLQSPGAPGALAPVPPAPPPAAPVTLEVWQGYFATHILRSKINLASQFLWSTAAVGSAYPGYSYYGSDYGANVISIDNILAWPMPGAPATTIMNPVVGTPFNAAGAYVSAGAPVGTVVLAAQMAPANALYPAWPMSPLAPDNTTQGARKHMTSWDQYGTIRSLSDHFAVFAVV